MTRTENITYTRCNLKGFSPFFLSLVENPEVDVLGLVLKHFGESELKWIEQEEDFGEAVLDRLLFIQDISNTYEVLDAYGSKICEGRITEEFLNGSCEQYTIPGVQFSFWFT